MASTAPPNAASVAANGICSLSIALGRTLTIARTTVIGGNSWTRATAERTPRHSASLMKSGHRVSRSVSRIPTGLPSRIAWMAGPYPAFS